MELSKEAKDFLAHIGGLGGQSKSPRKVRASRINGRKNKAKPIRGTTDKIVVDNPKPLRLD